MFYSSNTAIRAYADATAAGAMAQSPQGLVCMLFEGAQIAVAAARTHLQFGRIPQKCEAIAKAIAIVDDGLKAGLDLSAGGDIAPQLASLYDYIVLRLVQANASNRTEPLDEAGRLLAELAQAWREIGKPVHPPVPSASPEKV